MLRLVPCPSCKRHIFSREAACPHCRTSGPSFAAMVTLAATMGAAGCSAGNEPNDPPRGPVDVYGPPPVEERERLPESQAAEPAQAEPGTSAQPIDGQPAAPPPGPTPSR